MGVRYTGASVKRLEDPRLIAGRGRYTDDIQLPGMLHAAFVRSALEKGSSTATPFGSLFGAG